MSISSRFKNRSVSFNSLGLRHAIFTDAMTRRKCVSRGGIFFTRLKLKLLVSFFFLVKTNEYSISMMFYLKKGKRDLYFIVSFLNIVLPQKCAAWPVPIPTAWPMDMGVTKREEILCLRILPRATLLGVYKYTSSRNTKLFV
jgi:hypothetical protein